MTLETFFTEHPKAALGFSGGVDSAFLLWAGLRWGADIRPYYVNTVFQPAFELRDARRLAEQLGVALTVIDADILADENVGKNQADRCYHCKRIIFGTLGARAEAEGYPLLLDGSNASDDEADRPGMRALRELEVRSPLRECGLSKTEVRRLSREAGLFTWDKPAYACLATRVPAGQALTPDLLARIEEAEDTLHTLGFSDFRVRVLGEAARLQFPAAQMEAALQSREEILERLGPLFQAVLLDLAGR